ncbi:MAG: hypothetical protein GY703_12985 [Gammaproteobacteria bacterium]|nr:hypothetical protein [Gammaproteobacteria bacterium]
MHTSLTTFETAGRWERLSPEQTPRFQRKYAKRLRKAAKKTQAISVPLVRCDEVSEEQNPPPSCPTESDGNPVASTSSTPSQLVPEAEMMEKMEVSETGAPFTTPVVPPTSTDVSPDTREMESLKEDTDPGQRPWKKAEPVEEEPPVVTMAIPSAPVPAPLVTNPDAQETLPMGNTPSTSEVEEEVTDNPNPGLTPLVTNPDAQETLPMGNAPSTSEVEEEVRQDRGDHGQVVPNLDGQETLPMGEAASPQAVPADEPEKPFNGVALRTIVQQVLEHRAKAEEEVQLKAASEGWWTLNESLDRLTKSMEASNRIQEEMHKTMKNMYYYVRKCSTTLDDIKEQGVKPPMEMPPPLPDLSVLLGRTTEQVEREAEIERRKKEREARHARHEKKQ